MYRYGEYCPLARTTTILGDYWTPLIVREMLHGREHFNDLVRSLPEISRSLLASRLKALERAGLVERRAGDRSNASSYVLTESGRDLRRVLDAMSDWGERWADSHHDLEEIEPMATVCMLRARCRGTVLPPARVVVEMNTVPPRQSRSWLVLENGFASLCVSPPGFDVDLVVTTDVSTLYNIWLDQFTVGDAISRGSMQVEGNRAYARAFSSWFGPIEDQLRRHFDTVATATG